MESPILRSQAIRQRAISARAEASRLRREANALIDQAIAIRLRYWAIRASLRSVSETARRGGDMRRFVVLVPGEHEGVGWLQRGDVVTEFDLGPAADLLLTQGAVAEGDYDLSALHPYRQGDVR